MRDALMQGIVGPDVRLAVSRMPIGLAAAYFDLKVDFALLEKELPDAILSYIDLAVLCYKLSGCVAHTPTIRTMPLGIACEHSIFFVGHYPSQHSAPVGYAYPDGRAGDPTTAFLECVVASATSSPDSKVWTNPPLLTQHESISNSDSVSVPLPIPLP